MICQWRLSSMLATSIIFVLSILPFLVTAQHVTSVAKYLQNVTCDRRLSDSVEWFERKKQGDPDPAEVMAERIESGLRFIASDIKQLQQNGKHESLGLDMNGVAVVISQDDLQWSEEPLEVQTVSIDKSLLRQKNGIKKALTQLHETILLLSSLEKSSSLEENMFYFQPPAFAIQIEEFWETLNSSVVEEILSLKNPNSLRQSIEEFERCSYHPKRIMKAFYDIITSRDILRDTLNIVQDRFRNELAWEIPFKTMEELAEIQENFDVKEIYAFTLNSFVIKNNALRIAMKDIDDFQKFHRNNASVTTPAEWFEPSEKLHYDPVASTVQAMTLWVNHIVKSVSVRNGECSRDFCNSKMRDGVEILITNAALPWSSQPIVLQTFFVDPNLIEDAISVIKAFQHARHIANELSGSFSDLEFLKNELGNLSEVIVREGNLTEKRVFALISSIRKGSAPESDLRTLIARLPVHPQHLQSIAESLEEKWRVLEFFLNTAKEKFMEVFETAVTFVPDESIHTSFFADSDVREIYAVTVNSAFLRSRKLETIQKATAISAVSPASTSDPEELGASNELHTVTTRASGMFLSDLLAYARENWFHVPKSARQIMKDGIGIVLTEAEIPVNRPFVLQKFIRGRKYIIPVDKNEGWLQYSSELLFRYFDEPRTWNEAKEACEIFNSTLIVAPDPEKFVFINKAKPQDTEVWIGLQRNNYHRWVWLDNSVQDVEALFDSDGPPRKPCIAMDWNAINLDCNEVRPFICQRHMPDGVQWTNGLPRVFKTKVTWLEAGKACKRMGSFLARVNTWEMSESLGREGRREGGMWVGLRRGEEGEWEWDDHSPLHSDSRLWAHPHSHPPQSNQEEMCGYLDESGLHPQECWRDKAFLCGKHV